MTIEVVVLRECAGVLCDTRGQQIGEKARHDRWADKIVEPLQSFFEKAGVYIVEQIVNILHRDLEIFEPQLKRKVSVPIKTVALRSIPFRRHECNNTAAQLSEQDESAYRGG